MDRNVPITPGNLIIPKTIRENSVCVRQKLLPIIPETGRRILRWKSREKSKEFLFEAVNYQNEKRRIEVRKIDAKTGEVLKGAEFTLYEYSAAQKAYKEKGTLLDYDSSSELYVSSDY